jgi:putative Holliday junction resolvase
MVMRRLGIDYGSKRWGVAFADELGIATPLEAIVDADAPQRLRRLEGLIRQRRAQELVVGYPYNMDGSVGFKAKEVDAFVAQLQALFPEMPIRLVDERLSSDRAGEGWSEKRKRQERASGKLDSRAATLILRDYLEQLDPASMLAEHLAMDEDDGRRG